MNLPVFRLTLVLLPTLYACGTDPIAHTPDADTRDVFDATPDTADTPDTEVTSPIEGRALGLNDVTFLLPLTTFTTPLAPVRALLDEAVFTDLVTASGDVVTNFADLVPVAIRVDLCDRIAPGPCPIDADASLRVVLQPMFPLADSPHVGFEDVAVHAFYPIPRADLPDVIERLRAMADIADIPFDTPLQVNPALLADPHGAYRDALADLVADYAAPDRLIRLTAFAQFSLSAALLWLFRGVERASLDEPLAPVIIPGIQTVQQDVLALGRSSYDITPVVDSPEGLALTLAESAFTAATPERQRQGIAALAEIDNPAAHTSHTTQCANCHVTTQLAHHRQAGPAAKIGPFEPRPFDPNDAMDRSLRALGYVFTSPVVSQRAANETAAVATELEARFPSTR